MEVAAPAPLPGGLGVVGVVAVELVLLPLSLMVGMCSRLSDGL